ncbi:MAG: energy transducer TonB [Elusimicrobia bacterium]|nr:energy transducer TonB [Elusimicrobiota bacterium]
MAENKKKGPDLFQKCLAASFALHLGLLAGGRIYQSLQPRLPPEVDLEMFEPRLGTGAAKLGAPKREAPDARGLPKPAEDVIPPKPAPPEPPKEKEWVAAGAQTKVLEKLPEPAPTPGGAQSGTGTAARTGGSGLGSDTGVPGGTGDGGAPLRAWPKLLNRDELLANLRRFYPEVERRAGREGAVRVKLHIGVDGKVDPVEIAFSGGTAFDIAAREVGRRMRFSPAVGLNGDPVPVSLPQDIIFRLED